MTITPLRWRSQGEGAGYLRWGEGVRTVPAQVRKWEDLKKNQALKNAKESEFSTASFVL